MYTCIPQILITRQTDHNNRDCFLGASHPFLGASRPKCLILTLVLTRGEMPPKKGFPQQHTDNGAFVLALFVQEFNSMFSLLTVLQQMLVQHYSVQRRRINYYTHGIITPPIALHTRRTTRRSAVFSYKFHCYLY